MNNKLILIFLVVFLFGCKSDDASNSEKIDEDSLSYNIHSAPVSIVPKEDFPEWLQAKIDYQWEHYVVNPIHKSWLVIFKGEWNKRTVYHLWHVLSSDCAEIYYDDGTKPLFGTPVIPDINWVLIYLIYDGVVSIPG